ncbi:MAG: FAD-binding oxidoreductase [Anaerolineales bacterium]|nr:FAD-binding oxidoreductase [Anaerolineales bacterium]
MSHKSAEVVICGAGILGVSAAYFLSRLGVRDIVLIDQQAPLTLTSDKSTECYRNWWPGPGDAMVALMNRSISLMEEMAAQNGNLFHLNRRGYLYVSTAADGAERLRAAAAEASGLGAGELREHGPGAPGYRAHQPEGVGGPLGADLLDGAAARAAFPYLSADTRAALHVRRAGWLSAQTFGMWMLEQAKAAGAEVVSGRLAAVEASAGAVSGVALEDRSQIRTPVFINAAGPYLGQVSALLGVDIPISNEVHLKAAFNDHLGALPREAPLVICADEQELDWAPEERELLASDPQTAGLLERLPSGAHTRPEGDRAAQSILVLWDTHNEAVEPTFPIVEDPFYAELAVRGLARVLPGMAAYANRLPRPQVDGGYYTKTQENRPLAGPLGVSGAYLIGAASGYGVMAAAGLAELLAAHLTGGELPGYAPLFEFSRYADPDYQAQLAGWGESWQL